MLLTTTQAKRAALRGALRACREATLALVADLNWADCCQQAHPEFSPVGWHLGHMAFTESRWILEHLAGQSPLYPQYQCLFAADGLPKAARQDLPELAWLLDYLAAVRSRVLDFLQTAPILEQERLWYWLLQHESQHSETMTFLLQLRRWQVREGWPGAPAQPWSRRDDRDDMIVIPAGEGCLGYEGLLAQDNERPCLRVALAAYAIDRFPVTCEEYQGFLAAGGYQRREFWSAAGWRWLQEQPVDRPLYWSTAREWARHPVCGVSWYEAEAYATFVQKRLPTEAEWAWAARGQPDGQSGLYPWGAQPPSASRCNYGGLIGHTTPVDAYPAGRSPEGGWDWLGNVWEWTATRFAGYPGFVPYPYAGYSQVYFDDQHYVLRGGSWATQPWSLRGSFRNWYQPGVRQILAGFRCARLL